LSSLTDGEVRCADGDAAGFSCSQVDLLSFLTIDALGGQVGESVSDLWGWTDPSSGREYALVGRTAGLVIVDITDPAGPVQMGIVPANRSGARDIKVYADHVFLLATSRCMRTTYSSRAMVRRIMAWSCLI